MLEIVRELKRSPLCRGAAQCGSARRPGLTALCAQRLVPTHVHDLRSQPGFLTHCLAHCRVEPWAHFGIASLDIQPAAFQNPDGCVSAIDSAVANAGALDAAADTGVLGVPINIPDGFQTAPQSRDAF